MDYPVPHPSFIQHQLTVRTGSLWTGTQLLYDGTPLTRNKLSYAALDDAGHATTLKLKIGIGDPVPMLLINNETVRLAPPLTVSERVWICLPLLLLFLGGALGGLVGATAAYFNSHVFRSKRGTFAKYALSGLVSAGSIVAFLILATLLRAFFGWR